MRISSIFHRSAMCVRPDATLQDAASLMHAGGFGALPVYEGDTLAGILTERDLVAAIATGSNPGTATVGSWMSEEALAAGPEEDSVEVAERMLAAGVRHLPVVGAGRLVGIVSARDLLMVEAWPRLSDRS